MLTSKVIPCFDCLLYPIFGTTNVGTKSYRIFGFSLIKLTPLPHWIAISRHCYPKDNLSTYVYSGTSQEFPFLVMLHVRSSSAHLVGPSSQENIL